MEVMQHLKAVVRNGRLLLDEPTDLPDGTEVELVVREAGTASREHPWADMDPEERAQLEQEIEAGYRDFEKGDFVDARELLVQLRAKNA